MCNFKYIYHVWIIVKFVNLRLMYGGFESENSRFQKRRDTVQYDEGCGVFFSSAAGKILGVPASGPWGGGFLEDFPQKKMVEE